MIEYSLDVRNFIDDIITGFQREPLSFEDESVVRRALFSLLFHAYREREIFIELDKSSLGIHYYPHLELFRQSPVRTGYPENYNFDIAVLEAAGEMPVDSEEKNYSAYWKRKAAAGINIHFCTLEKDPASYLYKLKNDIGKFDQYNTEVNPSFMGYTVLFYAGDFSPEMNPSEYFGDIAPHNKAILVDESKVIEL